jgi:hypothetical protein
LPSFFLSFFLPFLLSFLHSFLLSTFLPSFRPSYHLSFLPSLPPSFLPSFLLSLLNEALLYVSYASRPTIPLSSIPSFSRLSSSLLLSCAPPYCSCIVLYWLMYGVAYYTACTCPQRPEEAPAKSPKRWRLWVSWGTNTVDFRYYTVLDT